MTARWLYRGDLVDPDWQALRDRVMTALLETFATHKSLSVQHTMYAMGQAALQAVEQTLEISPGTAQPASSACCAPWGETTATRFS